MSSPYLFYLHGCLRFNNHNKYEISETFNNGDLDPYSEGVEPRTTTFEEEENDVNVDLVISQS